MAVTPTDNTAHKNLRAIGGGVPAPDQASITALTDSTTGTASDTLDDTTASVKDDLASLAAKINEIRTALVNHGIVA